VAIACASILAVPSAPKARLGFALPTVVVDAVPFLAVTRVPATSSFVQLMVAGKGVNRMVVKSRLSEGLFSVLLMEEADDVPWMVATNQRSRLRDSASSMVGVKSAHKMDAKRWLGVERSIAQLTAEEFDANWRDATVSPLGKSSYVGRMEEEHGPAGAMVEICRQPHLFCLVVVGMTGTWTMKTYPINPCLVLRICRPSRRGERIIDRLSI
jgi:hypothetical protein